MILSILFISVYPAHFSSISLTPAKIIPYADVKYTFLLPCSLTAVSKSLYGHAPLPATSKNPEMLHLQHSGANVLPKLQTDCKSSVYYIYYL